MYNAPIQMHGAPGVTGLQIWLRYAQALLFVIVWVGIGASFRLGANEYLLLGVPLTLAFQLVVRRRPLREVWVRRLARPRGRKLVLTIALALAIVPGKALVTTVAQRDFVMASWAMAAVAGALAAAYAVTQLTRDAVKPFARCLLTAGTAGVVMMVGAAVARAFVLHHSVHANVVVGLRSLLLYFPATFVLEEVTFRGVLDAHVHAADAPPRSWASAVFISALWGVWHWPVVPHAGVPVAVSLVQLLVVHVVLGIPLSFAWRRTGNLAVPTFTHAFIDAVRNAFLTT